LNRLSRTSQCQSEVLKRQPRPCRALLKQVSASQEARISSKTAQARLQQVSHPSLVQN